MKLQVVKVKVLENATSAGIESDVNAYLATETQREFLGIQYVYNAFTGTFSALVAYTE